MNPPILPVRSMPPMPAGPVQSLPVEGMQQRIREVCGNFKLRPGEGRRMVRGGIELVRLGALEAALVGQSEVRITREVPDIRGDSGEHYFLIFQGRGRARMAQAGQAVVLAAGDAVLIDSAQPSLFEYGRGVSQQISLHLPRRELQQRFGSGLRPGLHVAAQDPLGIAMRAVLTRMFQQTDGAGAPLGEAFFSVFGALLLERRSEARVASAGRGDRVLAAALALIARQHRDPSLGAASLAQQLGVSARTLQRAFAPLGESPSRRILNTRLAACREALQTEIGRPVSAVAYDHGFNDLSFFYREFRKHYGQAPGRLVRGLDSRP